MLGANPVWVDNLKHYYEITPVADGGKARGYRRAVQRRIARPGQSWTLLTSHLVEFHTNMRLDEIYTGGEFYMPVELMNDEALAIECADRGTTADDEQWKVGGVTDKNLLFDFLCAEHDRDLQAEIALLAPRIIPPPPPIMVWEAAPESHPAGLGTYGPDIGKYRTTYGEQRIGGSPNDLPAEAIALLGVTLYMMKDMSSADAPWRGLTAAVQPAMILCTLCGAIPSSKFGSDLRLEGMFLCHPFTRFELEEAKWRPLSKSRMGDVRGRSHCQQHRHSNI